MLRRVLAWILLIGFVLLLLNIFVFKIEIEISLVIYVLIAGVFLLSNSYNKKTNK